MTVRRRKDNKNRWEYDFTYEGKRHRHTGFKTKAEAETAENEHRAALKNKSNVDTNITFDAFFKDWLDTHLSRDLHDATKRAYTNAHKQFNTYFGVDKRLNTLTRQQYQSFINDFGKSRAKSTMQKLHNILSKAFKDAEYDGYIERTPSYNIILNAGKDTQAADDKFIEIQDFVKIIERSKHQEHLSYFIIYVLCVTGVRFNEALHIFESDIDVDAKRIHVRGTKSKNANRYVELSSEDLSFILSRMREFPTNNSIKSGRARFEISHKATDNALKRLRNDIGIEKSLTLHMLRHTHCSLLLSKGVDMHYVSRRLGHANLTTTLNTYGHLLEERRSEEVDKTLKVLEQIRHKT